MFRLMYVAVFRRNRHCNMSDNFVSVAGNSGQVSTHSSYYEYEHRWQT